MLSKYFHSVKISDDVYALYNGLVFEPVFVDQKSKADILSENVSDDLKKTLVKKGIYVNDSLADIMAIDRLVQYVHNHKRRVSILYLITSTYCNLACKYCFIENNPNSKTCYNIMSEDIARVAVDKFLSLQEDGTSPEIIFYGGEPLTNFHVLEFIIPYIREKYGTSVKLTIISNATLIDMNVIELLTKYDVGIGISIDGPRHINDANRVFRNNDESVYDVVRDKINLLKECGCKFSISITVTRSVLNEKEKVLKWIEELGIKDIFWNLFHFSTPSDEWEVYYNEMSDFILSGDDELANYEITDGKVGELIRLFSEGVFRFESCGALGLNQIAITPNGDVCICHGDSRNDSYVVGNILTDSISDLVNSSRAKIWDGLLTVDREECLSCEALFVCGGGCPGHAETLFGSRKEIDKAACIFYKKYLKWILAKYFKAEVM